MTNPVLENIRRSLGRTDRSPVGLRPAIYAPRQPETVDAEISLFFDELQKLAGVGGRVATDEIAAKLKEESVAKFEIFST